MPRTDNPIDVSKDVPEEEPKDMLDEDMQTLELPMLAMESLLELEERPIEVAGLYFLCILHLKKHGNVPNNKKLGEMGCGSNERLAGIRKVAKEYGWMEDIFTHKDGRIVARRIKLTSPKLKAIREALNTGNLNLRNPGSIIINNNNTPNSERTEFGCSSSCSCSKEEKTPHKKEFPREQDFNDLWSINRHKVNKEEARKAWKSKPVQKSLPPKDVLLEAYEVDAQKNKWDEADEKYVPHLSTWLRNKRWENHTGEPLGNVGSVHIMTQLKKSDGIEDARQLRGIILDAMEASNRIRPKSFIRTYVKWLTSSDSPPATSKDSIKDVLCTNRKDSRYWDAYVEAGMPGMTKEEEV